MNAFAWAVVGSVAGVIGAAAAIVFGVIPLLRERRTIPAALQEIRTLNERFATVADQLGSGKPTVRLAGVYAMEGLADDWEERRQACVDVLCAYLRMPFEPDPGQDASEPQRHAFQAFREVRHTVIRVITAHLRKDAAVSWQGLNFDFTGVVFDGGDFRGAEFSAGTIDFSLAHFSGGEVRLDDARFSGATVRFRAAEFSGGTVFFNFAHFSGGIVDFTDAQFSAGIVLFGLAHFSGGIVDFRGAKFSGGAVGFNGAQFSDDIETHFNQAWFGDGVVDFYQAKFSGGYTYFNSAEFSGSTVSFRSAKFSSGKVSFTPGEFSGGTVFFNFAEFSGSMVDFSYARFSGAEVDFSGVSDWSVPPVFPWTDTPTAGVKLPGP